MTFLMSASSFPMPKLSANVPWINILLLACFLLNIGKKSFVINYNYEFMILQNFVALLQISKCFVSTIHLYISSKTIASKV